MHAIVPGSFDPFTVGHLDVVQRAAAVFGTVQVTIAENLSKQAWFSADERKAMAVEACAELPNVRVDTFDGLLVQYARDRGSRVIVKGLRGASDLEYELQMAHMNRLQDASIETVFLPTAPSFAYISSTLVREIALLGGSVAGLVPPCVVRPLMARAAERNGGRHHSST